MSQSPLVSVCMTSYNHARFLPAALDSILAQTFRDFELVAVDDGSKDGSLEILQSYASRHPRVVRVFTHPEHRNLGISATLNLATQNARGVYWCSHASDDVSYPARLERQTGFLEAHPEVGWIYGVADFIDKEGAALDGEFGADLSHAADLAEELILENQIAGQAAMVRMKFMRQVGPFDPALVYGDWELWVRLATQSPAAFLPGSVAGYRYHEDNTSRYSPRRDLQEQSLENYRRCLDVIDSLRSKSHAGAQNLGSPRKRAMLGLSRAAYLLLLKDQQSACRAVAEAFGADPSLRRDLKRLAHCLEHFNSLRLPIMVVRELGYPPRWMGSAEFLSALLRIGTHRLARST